MDNIILAIETSIKTGSLALLNGANVIDSWMGNNDVSRSEDLIPQISRLLEKNQIQPNELQKIAVSAGPGSFTGIRVGIAAAKGLSLALDCQLIGVSLLEAIAHANLFPETEKKIVVVSAGRDLYFWQIFQGNISIIEPVAGNKVTLESESDNGNEITIMAEHSAYENLARSNFVLLEKIRLVAGNCAELIGLYARDKNGESKDVFPLYIRPAVVIKG